MAAVKLLMIDELGFVPLSKTGAELLFEMISQRYERGATLPLGASRRMQSFACRPTDCCAITCRATDGPPLSWWPIAGIFIHRMKIWPGSYRADPVP